MKTYVIFFYLAFNYIIVHHIIYTSSVFIYIQNKKTANNLQEVNCVSNPLDHCTNKARRGAGGGGCAVVRTRAILQS